MGSWSLLNHSTSTISVPASIVPYLRSGLIAEHGSALDVLDAALEGTEVDPTRWRIGLAQLDYSRELLDKIGVSAGSADFGLNLELTPRLAQMFLDGLRAVYAIEVQRLADAAVDRVAVPSRAIPTLRDYIVDTEQQLGETVGHIPPYLEAYEKRTPRTVRGQ
jgi:hypothetical protein